MATTNICTTSLLEKKMINETDNAENLLLPNLHLIKKNYINWYWETKFNEVILCPCINSSFYSNILNVF